MSIPMVLVRHGPTAWNAEGRIQGWTDTPLSDTGRVSLAEKKVPESFAHYRCVSSPLRRALETAALLGCERPEQVTALKEMCWGDWEGSTHEELVRRYGEEVATRARQGLDFQPPSGESPRLVQRRLKAWFETVVADSAPVLAFTHKGVIRASLAMAIDWDMKGKMPVAIRWDCGHLFELDDQGQPALVEANIDLPLADNGG
jgi:probable phosphoglycerate mutase